MVRPVAKDKPVDVKLTFFVISVLDVVSNVLASYLAVW